MDQENNITEQKNAQAQIESLARFPNENPNPVLRVDQEGQILYANRASKEVLAFWGCEVGQFLPDEWRSVVADIFRSGSNLEIEITYQDTVWALSFTPIVPAGYVNVYGRDVTARNRAEQRLRRYAERLRVLHQTDEAILSARSAAEVAETALQQVPYLLPCQLAGVALLDLPARQATLLAIYSAAETNLEQGSYWRLKGLWTQMALTLVRGEPYVIEDLQALPSSPQIVRELQVEGIGALILEPLLVHDTLIGLLGVGLSVPGPLSAEQMEVLHELAKPLAIGLEQARLYEEVQGYARELEQRVQRRTAELEASQARFRAIFDEAPIGIALVDRRGRLLSTNPALQRILGYNETELYRTSLQELAPAEKGQDISDLFAALAAGKREYYRVEQSYQRQNGELIDANVTMALVHPRRGRVRLAIALIEDITERNRAQQALIQSERLALAGRLAASLAHEINNPLQSVIGCLGLANELHAEGEDASQFMDVAMEELQRASRIVHQMRDLGRREQGQKEQSDVNERIERVLLLTRKQCQSHRTEVIWQAEENLPLVPMVGDRIQQVFLNLIINAVDAMPEGGKLCITTAHTTGPDGVQVTFTDTGVGISPEELERLFEAFQSTKEAGLGLGLYISRNIVQEHGGRIDVQSEVGRGTTFTVWLPAKGE